MINSRSGRNNLEGVCRILFSAFHLLSSVEVIRQSAQPRNREEMIQIGLRVKT